MWGEEGSVQRHVLNRLVGAARTLCPSLSSSGSFVKSSGGGPSAIAARVTSQLLTFFQYSAESPQIRLAFKPRWVLIGIEGSDQSDFRIYTCHVTSNLARARVARKVKWFLGEKRWRQVVLERGNVPGAPSLPQKNPTRRWLTQKSAPLVL